MTVDDEIARMGEDEAKRRLRKLIALEPYRDTLIEIARYEQSKSVFIRFWHKIVIAAGAIAGALLGVWVLLEKWAAR